VPFVLPTRFVPFAAILAAVVACATPASDTPTDAPTHLDDFGDTIVAGRAQRIASLNPATTELIFAMGAGDRLVGRTHWDAYPDRATQVPDLGDGMRPNIEAVFAARPDLVLLYASAENRAARDAFRRAGIATLTLRIDAVADFARAMEHLGTTLGDSSRAAAVRDSVLTSIDRARALTQGRGAPRVVWPLWESPLLVVGRGSFLHELLDVAGAQNVFGDLDAPSPPVTFEEVVRRDPDVILVGPNRAATLAADRRWRTLRAVREGRVLVYDTLKVGRPGVRLGEAALHLATLLHPVPR
jgi:ABC-type Fe3+-hydroxamate transport system substrate-binding protein